MMNIQISTTISTRCTLVEKHILIYTATQTRPQNTYHALVSLSEQVLLPRAPFVQSQSHFPTFPFPPVNLLVLLFDFVTVCACSRSIITLERVRLHISAAHLVVTLPIRSSDSSATDTNIRVAKYQR